MAGADAGVGFIKKSRSAVGSKPSLLLAILVFILHFLAIVWLLHDRAAKPAHHSEQLIQFRLLPAATHKPPIPALELYRLAPATAVTIEPLLPLDIDIEKSAGTSVQAELSAAEDSGIFDPRLRKKLSDLGSRAAAQPIQQLKSWTDASGTQIVEVKQGECIRAMPGASNARGDNWSLRFKCGKSEGERMIDSVNADMAARNRRRHDK